MRWSTRRDGATAVFDDNPIYEPGNVDVMVIEPVITTFESARRCECGGAFGHRHALDGRIEIGCSRCHKIDARINLGTEVH
jgi:hypothetical protein